MTPSGNLERNWTENFWRLKSSQFLSENERITGENFPPIFGQNLSNFFFKKNFMPENMKEFEGFLKDFFPVIFLHLPYKIVHNY